MLLPSGLGRVPVVKKGAGLPDCNACLTASRVTSDRSDGQ
jgi:hypothetical protein